MKRQRWQKAVALLAGVVMIGTTPETENLVETSCFVRAESIPEEGFYSGETEAQEVPVITQYSEEEGWSSGGEENPADSGLVEMVPEEAAADAVTDAETAASVPMQVSVTLNREAEEVKAQGEAQWVQIHAEDRSQAQEGESRVRIHLYNGADKNPAEDAEVFLFTEKQESIPETATVSPTILKGALSGGEDLTVSRDQVYQQDENGTLITDENGQEIATDDYLEFTLPAGETADFYAALIYRDEQETYAYDVLLSAEALEKYSEMWTNVLEQNEALEKTVSWKNPEEPEAEAADTENEDSDANASEENASGGENTSDEVNADEAEADEGASEPEVPAQDIPDENLSSILVTMTKELGENPGKADANEPEESEEAVTAEPEASEETDANESEVSEENAVSGQTYAVHVQVQDLKPEAKYDSVVSIYLKDLATGMPDTDVAAAAGLTKEAVLTSKSASEAELPGAVTTPAGVQDLAIARMQETGADENGETAVTADYLQFTLPAGSSADFYLGLTYATEEADYNKQLALEVKAVQYVPIEEAAEPSASGDADNAASYKADQNTAEDFSQEEFLTDEATVPTVAAQELLSATAGIAGKEMVGPGAVDAPAEEAENAEVSSTEDEPAIAKQSDAAMPADAMAEPEVQETSDEPENQTESPATKTVDVLAGAQMLTMTWSAVTRSVSGQYSDEQVKELQKYLEEHPNSVLMDFSNSNAIGTQDWNSQTYLYCSVMVNGSAWFQQTKRWEINGATFWEWDLSNSQYDGQSALFGYTSDWNTNNSNDYYKTDAIAVSSLRGKLYQIVGNNQYSTGKMFYTLNPVEFARSPLSGKTVYLDVTEIQNMETSPKIKIMDVDGEITYKEMTLCPEEENIYAYRFDSYLLPGTTFQFVGSSDESAIPSESVANFDQAFPCYNGIEWMPYSPKTSTVKIHVQHSFSEGITVVYTKDGVEVGRESNDPSPFDFDLYSEEYNGFYIKKQDGTADSDKQGNRTVIAGMEDIRAAASMHETTELNAWVGGWLGNTGESDAANRSLSFTAYGNDGDASLNIPLGTFERKEDVLYVQSTFYDYYSDVELEGKNRKNLGAPNESAGSNDKIQARNFNSAISSYFSGTSVAQSGGRQSPLYFGEFTNAHPTDVLNFVWENNNGEPNRENGAAAARQGLVDSKLNDSGQLTMGGVIAPYFNENFLRGANSMNTNIGYVFSGVEFPFVKNDQGYWEFKSSKSDETLRMKRDPSGFYYLDQVGASNAVKGHTSSQVTTNANFFPFNDKTESGDWGKLNYAFGVRMDIPFYMTADGTVNLNGQDQHIVFDFRGDDDIWIFIDGQLVLDIGGDHGAVAGKIDFKDRTASTTTRDTEANGFLSGKHTFSEDLVNPSKEHTLTIFYMERGLWESNMEISFNFPQSNELEVEKEVVIPDGVNRLFSDAIQNMNTIEFPISIENLATSYEHVGIQGDLPAVEKVLDLITSTTNAKLHTPKTSAVCTVGNGGGRNEVLRYYYPGVKNYSEGQDVTDARSIFIDTNLNFDNSEQIKEKGYIQLDTYVDSSVSATDPFVALVDDRGNRIGGWISGSAYDSSSKSMGSRVWKTLRIVIDKLQPIHGSNFNYAHITQIQFAYHANVDIYIDNIYIKASPTYVQSGGFTKDDKAIPDYGSRLDPYQLQPVNGAEYTNDRTGITSHVTDGRVYLKDDDEVTFSDQFRRNSYLRVEETVDNVVFDTSWLLYEDGKLQAQGSGTCPSDGKNAVNESGEAIANPPKPDQSILFMSETNSLTDYFVKTVKYVNTLKLGSIAIEKDLAEGQVDDGKEYTFEIIFSNVAGFMLEGEGGSITKTVTVKAGSENREVISGIPAGTQYIIREVKGNGDTFTLVDTAHIAGDDGYVIDSITHSVTGIVKNTGTNPETDVYKFTNDIRESVEVSGEKTWVNTPTERMPESITIRLQRKLKDDDDSTFERAKDMDAKEVPDKVLTDADSDNLNENIWRFQFGNVPKYNGTGLDKKEYVYRVVEVDNGGNIISDGGRFNDIFVVDYSDQKTDADGNITAHITNTFNPRTSLKVTKQTPDGETLDGVKFKLEKQGADGTYTQISELTTGPESFEAGVVQWNDLEEGMYRLTETKAAEGYSLLKEPIIITIDRSNDSASTVDNESVTIADNTISIVVTNQKKFDIPATGSWSRYIMSLSGAILAGLAIIMYLLQKRRREGRTS